jgi:lipopolysaccharide transport system ATP-binding protein
MMTAGSKFNPTDLRIVSNNEHPNSAETPPTPNGNGRMSAIDVSGVTLQYPIGPYVRGSLKASFFRLFGHRDRIPRPTYVDAIKNLTLKVEHGERVGVIGSNGSGKSTLLRALAGIYPVKKGTVQVQGSIGTLLDTTLGFETESTGRENIYYRGVSMGYPPKALREVEQEIIEFADLHEFIDLPMRTYSAGMYVRLGFAISTQFSPDVLLIDEVFAAGDAAFASRALDRMQKMVNRSGIMVMASHDMSLLTRICSRVLWLDKGVLVRDGPPQVVLPQYEAFSAGRLALD